MSIVYNVKVPSGVCFCLDGLNPKSYSGSGTVFTELISGVSTNAVVSGGATLGIVNGHLRFVPGANTRVAYIPFSSSSVTVPTGNTGSWSWFQYFEDQGNIDHPNIGKETGSGWDGVNGFVFGTGWGTDGPRWGIGGTAYSVYGVSPTDYVNNVWQCWTVTFSGNDTNGLKTYVNGQLVDQRTPTAATIGSNGNDLFIGATNSRGGNWGGYMDIVQMWTRALSANEVLQNYYALKGRVGL